MDLLFLKIVEGTPEPAIVDGGVDGFRGANIHAVVRPAVLPEYGQHHLGVLVCPCVVQGSIIGSIGGSCRAPRFSRPGR